MGTLEEQYMMVGISVSAPDTRTPILFSELCLDASTFGENMRRNDQTVYTKVE